MDGNLLMSSGNETTKNVHIYITHPHGENSLQGLLQLNSLQGLLQLKLHNARLYLEVGRGERGGRQRREEGREAEEGGGEGEKNEQSGGGREKGETGASLPMSFLIGSS